MTYWPGAMELAGRALPMPRDALVLARRQAVCFLELGGDGDIYVRF